MTVPDITGKQPDEAAQILTDWAQEDPPGRAQAALDALDGIDVLPGEPDYRPVADAAQTFALWAEGAALKP